MPSLCADVAQLVEQRIRNAKVGSSTLFIGTTPYSKAVQKKF